MMATMIATMRATKMYLATTFGLVCDGEGEGDGCVVMSDRVDCFDGVDFSVDRDGDVFRSDGRDVDEKVSSRRMVELSDDISVTQKR